MTHDRSPARRPYRLRLRRLSDGCPCHYDEQYVLPPSQDLFVDVGPEWVETGVLAEDGSMILRPGREPIGYLTEYLSEDP